MVLFNNPSTNTPFTVGNILPTTQDYLNLGLHLPSDELDYANINSWVDFTNDKSDEYILQLIFALSNNVNQPLTTYLNLNYLSFTYQPDTPTPSPSGTPTSTPELYYIWTQSGIDFLIQNETIEF